VGGASSEYGGYEKCLQNSIERQGRDHSEDSRSEGNTKLFQVSDVIFFVFQKFCLC
jgi:hypothetical protein